MHSFFKQVYQITRRIPSGRVMTYGQIAGVLGAPQKSRAVGYALHVNPDPTTIPCHRVVNRFGGLAPNYAFKGPQEQARRLRREGIEIRQNTVDLSKYQFSRSTLATHSTCRV